VSRIPGAGSRTPRWLGPLFILVAFAFLGYFVATNVGALREHPWTIRPGLLVASLALHIVALAWGVAVWQRILARMDIPAPFVGLLRVWFVSGLGRYIPGKIWQFVGAAHLGGALGLRPGATVTALAVHTGFFLVAALGLSVYLVPTWEGVQASITVLRWLAPLLLLTLHPRIIGGAVDLFRRLTGRALARWHGSWMSAIGLAGLACIGWILMGASLHLFLLSLTPLPASALPGVIGINALSFAIGYAVFIAPAGLGAKEVSLAALLTFYVPAPVAALLAVAARLWSLTAELIPAIPLLLIRPAPHATGSSPTPSAGSEP